MNVQLPVHIDKPAFLAWLQGREQRYELAWGRIVTRPGTSRAHGLIVGNLFTLLRGQLDPKQWAVIVEFGLDAGPETLRFPDLVVDRAGGGAADYVATAPVLLCLAWYGYPYTFLVITAASFASDVLDGTLAR